MERDPQVLKALRLLRECRYDEETVQQVLREGDRLSKLHVEVPVPFGNRPLLRSAQRATQKLHALLCTMLDDSGTRFLTDVRCSWPGAPDLDDQTVLAALRVVEEYLRVHGGPRRKGPDLRQHAFLRNLHRLLSPKLPKTIQAEKVYDAVALLKKQFFGGKRVKAAAVRKLIEQSFRKLPRSEE
jgi:hypothetical protein